jgi:hypothetical protein
MQQERMFSNTAMTVDRAAKAMNRKNRLPHSRPPAMRLKRLGRVMKISRGPLSALTPKAEQAGKMIRPEATATKVSSAATRKASPHSACSRPMANSMVTRGTPKAARKKR